MEGGTVEMWVKKVDDENYTVGFGDRKIEVTCADGDLIASQWVREVQREQRKRGGGRSAPLIAGICAFRTDPPGHWTPKFLTMKDGYWVSLISICVFGSRCLLIPTDDDGYQRRPLPVSVRSFLADRRVRLVGVGLGKLADKMERDWDFRVNSPSELRPLVEDAFGKEAVARSGTRRGAAGLEELAHVALGGVRVKKKPGRLHFNRWWCIREVDQGEVMHATIDAFMACEIGTRSLEVIDGRR